MYTCSNSKEQLANGASEWIDPPEMDGPQQFGGSAQWPNSRLVDWPNGRSALRQNSRSAERPNGRSAFWLKSYFSFV